MRIVIDMQGAQSVGSRFGNIGRFAMSLSKAIVRDRGEHEVVLALNGFFAESIETIRAALDRSLPQENIRTWYAPGPVDYLSQPQWRREVAEHIREYFIARLKPDLVLVTSLIEGFEENAVTSVRKIFREIPTAVICHDLTPYIYRNPYFEDPVVEAFYLNKLDQLRRADLFFALSESSRKSAVRHLGVDERSVINVGTAPDVQFRVRHIPPARQRELMQRYGLQRPFVIYSGGIKPGKNVEALLRAYVGLQEGIRERHQLVIVCAAEESDRQRVIATAEYAGLKKHELIVMGIVPDEDLIDLYNLCTVSVFPSAHEGSVLPALEALSCGAPVIAAGTSSLQEMIGSADASFDERNDGAIAAKLSRVLTDEVFRQSLSQRGLEQAKRFTVDDSAKRALCAFEELHRGREKCRISEYGRRAKLAYISPLPPEHSGISDYSAELLPELSRYYDIDVVVDQEEIRDTYITAAFPSRTVEWFRNNAFKYDRVLYHFGNSHFHRHMFGLLQEIPGVVVLHDFFLANLLQYMEAHLAPNALAAALYTSHGYDAVQARFHVKPLADVVVRYPCNLHVLQQASGIIVHSASSLRLAEQWYGGAPDGLAIIPLLRASGPRIDKVTARKALGFGTSDFLVCAFGLLGPMKLNHRLVQAWRKSSLAQDKTCHLIFVGENDGGDYGQEFLATLHNNSTKNNIRITGWVDLDVFRQYLVAADIAVQLRTLSRGETSAAVFDCMNYGLATIVNAHGSMADLDDNAVRKLPDEFTDAQLIEELETLWKGADLRKKLAAYGQQVIAKKHEPRTCARQYYEAIERFSRAAASGTRALASSIASLECRLDDRELAEISEAIAWNMPRPFVVRQLLVDISVLVQFDLRTGIQRVVRAVLREWLSKQPSGIRVEPVYTTGDGTYHYARQFTLDFLSCPRDVLDDAPVEFRPGDILFMLDFNTVVVEASRAFYQRLRAYGVQVVFMVYDLLPIRMPGHFLDGAPEAHARWLAIVAEGDGAVCISKATADDLAGWFSQNGPTRQRSFKTQWFHIGADIHNSAPTIGLPADAHTGLDRLRSRRSFLMVGTIEPRKGHAQVLEAFERLWHDGQEINFVIVGKNGWKVEETIQKLLHHPERGERLFWLESISDEYLERIYAASTCLIAASVGEGFGLPLIEAARHKLPIIARDIPVFREVAGEHAFYFTAKDSDALVVSIKEWLALYHKGKHPKSDTMPWLSWTQSADRLQEILLQNDWVRISSPERRQTERAPGLVPQGKGTARQLLLDVSTTCRTDLKTGIERVTRALTRALLERPPEGFRVAPVYLSDQGGAWHYRYAQRFTLDLLGRAPSAIADDAAELRAGDVLLGLDISGQMLVEAEAAGLFAGYRMRGVTLYFTVYDLLPLRLPQCFPPGSDASHEAWLRAVLKMDGALCISRTVADDLADWMQVHYSSRQRPVNINWFRLGADISDVALSRGSPKEAERELAAIAARPSFLMVGTIEPRKGYLQALDAFDRLWAQGIDINLTIVGAEGWRNVSQDMRRTIPQIIARLASHPERGKRLFWVNGPSDEYLEKIYAACCCLIAASEGEGFGLPLIEAARHRLPIIARGIPVFREVAGEHAFYFAGHDPDALVAAIEHWLALYAKGEHPKSDAITWLTWTQCADHLKKIVLKGDGQASVLSNAGDAHRQEVSLVKNKG
jgi:glycosyltransferase involved in cell wall biosynthesis